MCTQILHVQLSYYQLKEIVYKGKFVGLCRSEEAMVLPYFLLELGNYLLMS